MGALVNGLTNVPLVYVILSPLAASTTGGVGDDPSNLDTHSVVATLVSIAPNGGEVALRVAPSKEYVRLGRDVSRSGWLLNEEVIVGISYG